MSNSNQITVDINSYLNDCPPHDTSIPDELNSVIAKEIADNFDYTLVYNEIDRLACAAMRKHGLID
jgi:hypothetical protein